MKPKRKFKKIKKINVRVLADLTLLFIFLTLLSYLLFISDLLKIKEIVIRAGDLESEMLAVKFLSSKIGDNLIIFDSEKIKKEILSSHVEIKNISIKKSIPAKIYFEIENRCPLAVYCQFEEKCLLIDGEAVVFKKIISKEEKEDLPVIISYDSEQLDAEKLGLILEIWKRTKGLGIEMKEIRFSKTKLEAKTAEGWEAYFDSSKDINLALMELRLLLEKEISFDERKNLKYIDLRFSKIYYK